MNHTPILMLHDSSLQVWSSRYIAKQTVSVSSKCLPNFKATTRRACKGASKGGYLWLCCLWLAWDPFCILINFLNMQLSKWPFWQTQVQEGTGVYRTHPVKHRCNSLTGYLQVTFLYLFSKFGENWVYGICVLDSQEGVPRKVLSRDMTGPIDPIFTKFRLQVGSTRDPMQVWYL